MTINSKPDYGVSIVEDKKFVVSSSYQAFFDDLETQLTNVVPLPQYTVATVPTAGSFTGGMIFVTDETGGSIPAFSDGTDWRRVTDRAIIS